MSSDQSETRSEARVERSEGPQMRGDAAGAPMSNADNKIAKDMAKPGEAANAAIDKEFGTPQFNFDNPQTKSANGSTAGDNSSKDAAGKDTSGKDASGKDGAAGKDGIGTKTAESNSKDGDPKKSPDGIKDGPTKDENGKDAANPTKEGDPKKSPDGTVKGAAGTDQNVKDSGKDAADPTRDNDPRKPADGTVKDGSPKDTGDPSKDATKSKDDAQNTAATKDGTVKDGTAKDGNDPTKDTTKTDGKDGNKQDPIAKATDELKTNFNVNGDKFNPEQARQSFAQAADGWRAEHPDSPSTQFATDFNKQMTDKVPTTSQIGRNVDHLTAGADTNGNLSLKETTYTHQDNVQTPHDKLIAEAKIGDPMQGTQSADNVAKLHDAQTTGQLTADQINNGVPPQQAGAAFGDGYDTMKAANPKASDQEFAKAFNEKSRDYKVNVGDHAFDMVDKHGTRVTGRSF